MRVDRLVTCSLPATCAAGDWAALDVEVLAMHGEFDWVSARRDHEAIASIAGARGRFVELAGLDHAFTRHDSLEESYRNDPDGVRTDAVARALVAWLDRITRPEPIGTAARPVPAVAGGISPDS